MNAKKLHSLYFSLRKGYISMGLPWYRVQELIEAMSQMAAHSRKLSDSEKVSREERKSKSL
jgi:hypothetical protein